MYESNYQQNKIKFLEKEGFDEDRFEAMQTYVDDLDNVLKKLYKEENVIDSLQ